jgi:hypothetical protein
MARQRAAKKSGTTVHSAHDTPRDSESIDFHFWQEEELQAERALEALRPR